MRGFDVPVSLPSRAPLPPCGKPRVGPVLIHARPSPLHRRRRRRFPPLGLPHCPDTTPFIPLTLGCLSKADHCLVHATGGRCAALRWGFRSGLTRHQADIVILHIEHPLKHTPASFGPTGGRCAALRWGFRSGLPNVRGARYVLGISFAPGSGALAAPRELSQGNGTRNSTVAITLRNATSGNATAGNGTTTTTTPPPDAPPPAPAAGGGAADGDVPLLQSLELIISLEPLKRSERLDARKDYRWGVGARGGSIGLLQLQLLGRSAWSSVRHGRQDAGV